MSDRIIRSAEQADPIIALAWRLRTDEIDPKRVAYAAALGHPVALQVMEPAWLPDSQLQRVEKCLRLMDTLEITRFAEAVESGHLGGPDSVGSGYKWGTWRDRRRPRKVRLFASGAATTMAHQAVAAGKFTWDELLVDLADRLLA